MPSGTTGYIESIHTRNAPTAPNSNLQAAQMVSASANLIGTSIRAYNQYQDASNLEEITEAKRDIKVGLQGATAGKTGLEYSKAAGDWINNYLQDPKTIEFSDVTKTAINNEITPWTAEAAKQVGVVEQEYSLNKNSDAVVSIIRDNTLDVKAKNKLYGMIAKDNNLNPGALMQQALGKIVREDAATLNSSQSLAQLNAKYKITSKALTDMETNQAFTGNVSKASYTSSKTLFTKAYKEKKSEIVGSYKAMTNTLLLGIEQDGKVPRTQYWEKAMNDLELVDPEEATSQRLRLHKAINKIDTKNNDRSIKAFEANMKNTERDDYITGNDLNEYKEYLQVAIDNNKLTKEEAAYKIVQANKIIAENKELVNVKDDFDFYDLDNDSMYKTVGTKSKAYIKDKLQATLSDNNVPLYEKVIAANNLQSVSKSITNTWFPFTNNTTSIAQSRQLIDDLKKIDGGQDILNRMPTNSKLLYAGFDAIGKLPGADDTVAQEEVKIITDMLATAGNLDDYGVNIREKIKVDKTLSKSVEGLPDNVQQELMLTYHYLSQSMTAKEAANYVKKEVLPNHITKVDTSSIPFMGQDATFIGFSDSVLSNHIKSDKAPKLTENIYKLAKFSGDKGQLKYNSNNNTITVTNSGTGLQMIRTVKVEDLCKVMGMKNCTKDK